MKADNYSASHAKATIFYSALNSFKAGQFAPEAFIMGYSVALAVQRRVADSVVDENISELEVWAYMVNGYENIINTGGYSILWIWSEN